MTIENLKILTKLVADASTTGSTLLYYLVANNTKSKNLLNLTEKIEELYEEVLDEVQAIIEGLSEEEKEIFFDELDDELDFNFSDEEE